MSLQTNQPNYTRILKRIEEVRKRGENLRTARTFLLSFAVWILITILALAAEALFQFDTTGRALLFFIVLLGMPLAVLAGSFGPAIAKRAGIASRASDDTLALKIGMFFPGMKDRLLNALQVYREQHGTNPPGYSPALVDASFSDVACDFESLDLTPVTDTAPAKQAGKAAAVAFVCSVAVFAFFPTAMQQSLTRIADYQTDYVKSAPFDFVIEPGTIEAVKGQSVTLRAKTTSAFRPELTIYVKEDGQDDFATVPAAMDSSGAYVYEIDGIRSTTAYYAEALSYRSDTYTVTVVDRPFVRNMRIKLSFPGYTGLSDRYLDDNTGDITALKGTQVSYELALNKEIASGKIVFGDTTETPMKLNGTNATAGFRLMKNGSYRFELADAAGIASVNPITYTTTVVPDMAPAIELLQPSPATELDENMRVPVVARISDDFGFSKLTLNYRLAASRYEQPQKEFTSVRIPLPQSRRNGDIIEVDVPYMWNLAGMSLVPEDVVNFYVEVFDNDAVSGTKSARSQIYTLRLPSMEEVYARADKTQEKALEDLQETLKKAEDVKESLDELQREMKQNNTRKLDWQQKKKLEDAIKKHEEMLKEVSKVQEELKDLTQDMQKQNAISEETLEKYQEMQQLMQEIQNEDLQNMMRKMNEQMQNISPEQMQQAMENFQFSEENFRKSLDRTIELLKRLQIEQKVDEIAKRAEDLAQKQEDLANRTENANPNDQKQLDKLAEEQRQMQKDAEAMQREMNQLAQQMQEFPHDMPLSEMKEAQSEMNLQQMQQQMSQSASQCQGGNCKKASAGQKKSSEQMKKVAKKMQQVKKKMQEDQQRMVANALKKALENLLELSKKQEQLKNETASLPTNSQQFRQKMEEQMNVMEQLNQTANELMELSKKSFEISPQMAQHMGMAMKKMQRSMENMGKRDSKRSGQEQGGAMMELNEAAKEIAKSMSSSKSGGTSAGSMMQQLSQMAKQQQMINMNMPNPGGQQMSQEQMQQMQRMLAQQRAVQKSLQQLNEEAKQSKDSKRLLGDLDKIAEDMQEVIRDMGDENISPETRNRQERILSRLLDASKSMNERDWEKRRKSRSGEDVARRSPSAIDPNALDEKTGLKYEMQKAIDEGYSRDYENRIRAYFEALEKNAGKLGE